MGVLTGKFDADSQLPKDDVRGTDKEWLAYFKDGRVTPAFLNRLEAIREILQTGGRSLTKGALGWLWARSPTPHTRVCAAVLGTLKGRLARP